MNDFSSLSLIPEVYVSLSGFCKGGTVEAVSAAADINIKPIMLEESSIRG